MLTVLQGTVLACHLAPDFEAFGVAEGSLRLE